MSDFFFDCTDYFFDAPKICGIAHNRRNQDFEAFRNLFLNHGPGKIKRQVLNEAAD